MKEGGSTTRLMAKENTRMPMELHITASGIKTNSTEMGKKLGLTVLSILENTMTDRSMD